MPVASAMPPVFESPTLATVTFDTTPGIIALSGERNAVFADYLRVRKIGRGRDCPFEMQLSDGSHIKSFTDEQPDTSFSSIIR